MSKQLYRNVMIAIGLIAIMAVISVLFNSYKDQQIIDETTKLVRAQENIALLKREAQVRETAMDSIKKHIGKLEIILQYKEKNPTIIIEKYEKEHTLIDNLTNDESFDLFARNLEEYRNNKDRYRLSRFRDRH